MSKTANAVKYLLFAFAVVVCAMPAAAGLHDWKDKGTTADGRRYELVGVEDGQPIYYITCNAAAAVLTGADILQAPPYSLDGEGVTVGLWSSGMVLATHNEFVDGEISRVTLMDANTVTDDHSTHVAGTIGASGNPNGDPAGDPSAKGMAPAVSIDSYHWGSDSAEMLSRGATGAGEDKRIYLSDHPYSIIAGWQQGNFIAIPGDFNGDDVVDEKDLKIFTDHWLAEYPNSNYDARVDLNDDGKINFLDYAIFALNWRVVIDSHGKYWFGVWGQVEDRNFGRYSSIAAEWDSVCYSAPYYLPFKAAGNDRDDDAPWEEQTFLRLKVDPENPDAKEWVEEVYGPADPCDDGGYLGYDSIPIVGVAKNIMTVGAVDNWKEKTEFTGFGPSDDGRIKPDIVSPGKDLYSCTAQSDSSYDSKDGTSMASASAAGSTALLVEYYGELFDGDAMRASTLKGLIIHTAEDQGNDGPDYRYGWGLIDVNSAAEYIKKDANDVNAEWIIEGTLTDGSSDMYTFTFDGSNPYIRATLCWTDPAAEEVDGLDDSTARLVNDLDLRIDNDLEIVYEPYVLDPDNPSSSATMGDNKLDNVEQVYIFGAPAGTYTARIRHKGTLTNGSQGYSLILSEGRPVRHIWVDDDGVDDPVEGLPDPAVGGPNSDPNEDGSSEHPFDSIQKAVDDANEGSTIIMVRKGTYTGVGNYNITPGHQTITVKSEEGPGDCIVDCEWNGRAFILKRAATDLEGFTIINGFAKDSSWPQEPDADSRGYGGAIYCNNSSPKVRDCIITDNEAESGGGAIFLYNNSNASIGDCQISLNICGTGLSRYNVEDMNSATVALEGGGIYCRKNSSPEISNCVITRNEAEGGGGGIAIEDSNDRTADFNNCDISFNQSWTANTRIDRHGGGIYLAGSDINIYNNCTFEGNSSRQAGGAIAVWEKSNAWVRNCSIIDNFCLASSGGICTSNANSTIINCLIASNIGHWNGGVSSLNNSSVKIVNCTIADNGASWDPEPYAGGLSCWFNSAAEVTNSILWGNTPMQITLHAVDPNDVTVKYSDVQMFDANGVVDPGSVWEGTGNINEDPLFARARSDYHLKSEMGRWDPDLAGWVTDNVDSPCIDAGDPESAYDLEPEPNGERVNMGAYGNTKEASKSP